MTCVYRYVCERGREIQLQDYILKYYQKDIYAHKHIPIYLIFS